MAEILAPQDKEAFEAFKKKYNLDPPNHLAIMNCLFEQADEIRTLNTIVSVLILKLDIPASYLQQIINLQANHEH